MHKRTYQNPQTRQPLPTAQEWAASCDLKRCGQREWNGPCPLCGGRDRFHVQDRGDGTLVGCRGCIDDGIVKLTDLVPTQRLGHSLSC